MKVNHKSGRNDSIPWWGPIAVRNRQIKAEEEARIVRQRFGNVGLVDQKTKERIADLINLELIDLIYFEARAGTPDEHGVRPSLAALRAKRQREIQNALKSVRTPCLHDRADEQQAFQKTRSVTGGKAQSNTEAETSSQNQGLRPYSKDSNEAFAADEKSKDEISHGPIDTQRGSSETSSETVGKSETREDPGTADDLVDIYTEEAQEPSPELGGVAVTTDPGEMSSSGLPSISANESQGSLRNTVGYNSNTRDSATLGEQLSRTAISGAQTPTLDCGESPVVPRFIQVESQEKHQELLKPSPLITIPDPTPQSLLPQERGSIAHPKMTTTGQFLDTFHQNPPMSNHTDLTAIQTLTPAATPSFSTFSQGDTAFTVREHTMTEIPSSPPAVPFHPAVPVGWNHLKWAYRTHTAADYELQRQGIWLYDRPKTFLSHQSSKERINMTLQPRITVLQNTPNDMTATKPSFLCNASTMVLYAHQSPWSHDPRSTEQSSGLSPDSLFYTRLTEYQALEALGMPVWRHDRNHLPCRNPACPLLVSDMVASTLICTSCGPKSRIRYCSPNCYLQDLYRHSKECGLDQFLITTIIDDATAPPRFSHLLPSIRERNGLRNFPLHRQRVHAQATGGRYTLFNPASGEPTALYFDYQTDETTGKEAPYRGYLIEMEARMERCLNIAFYDHTQTIVIEYLARLIQQCLNTKGAWNPALARVVANQFAQEFNFNVRASWRNVAAQPLCECEWAGDDVLAHRHVAGCISRSRMQGEVFRGRRRCLKDLVGAMEAKHWVLRAWRTQHPTESDGQRRVMGHGFPGCVVPAGWMPKLGKGWRGFWSGEDDICV
ncbi:MAG: hypothetical protein Q9188_005859 [Gyalolechia gomerana]